VPEYILNKPGRLTREEMEIMKIHPREGAEILSAVPFPFPLVPIVRHHHERWDGAGYPDGLPGERIPIGARILTAVDCFDAITTDRPYRKAVSRDEAFAFLRDQSGKMFDPRVVETLLEHAEELEAEILRLEPPPAAIDRQAAPDLGIAETSRPASEPVVAPTSGVSKTDDLEAEVIENVRRVTELGLATGDRLQLLSGVLGELIPHRSLVVYVSDGPTGRLAAHHAVGRGARALRGHTVPHGERMAGWCARNRRPYAGRLHRNPLERDGSRSDLEELASDPEIATLTSAIVAPLEKDGSLVGVLALYGDATCPEYDAEATRRIGVVAPCAARVVGPSPEPRRAPSPARDLPTT
jgi:hypothetical protein